VKSKIESLPESLGRPLAYVPFRLRLGRQYANSAAAIRTEDSADSQDRQHRIFLRVRSLVEYACEHVEFYAQHYRRHAFSPAKIQSFEDICRIPVVTKADLQSVPLSARCASGVRGMKINTGGTSGRPLEFFLDNHAFAREWAHMHHLWGAHGYRPHHVKLTFRGKYFSDEYPIRYNAVHNEYIVNANSGMSAVIEAVLRLPRSRAIRWVHGYPSLVAEFAHAMTMLPVSDLMIFQTRLYGVLLGSEYPAPAYRKVISRNLSGNIVSWYGHSEMAVLARETLLGVYSSYPTYGLAEAVPLDDGSGHRLVCTSLHNRAHPFIRYDTGDLIDPVSRMGGALSFRIREGRVGDFVLDRCGKKLSLTAIIFGRHHPAFSLIRHVQVCDHGSGRIVLVVVPQDDVAGSEAILAGFDLNDLDIDLELRLVDSPIRTPAGKIRLKVDPSSLLN
ncbi:MAG: hypothetical protein RL244_2625, partial [Pseudomonadota bacterium]|jgi:phenylacetate-CoA ligase